MTLNTVQALDPAAVAAEFGDLPTLAPVAVEVLRLADDDTATLEEIASVISNDPGLAAQMLKVANSPIYGMGGTVASLSRAASILGLRTVRLLSLSFAVIASTSGDTRDAIIWRRTLASSAIGQTIAHRFDRRLVDETFIAGLLANVGRLALMRQPRYADTVVSHGGWLDTADEQLTFETTGDAVSAHILTGWGLWTQLADAIAHRAQPQTADGVVGQSLASSTSLTSEASSSSPTTDGPERARAVATCRSSRARTRRHCRRRAARRDPGVTGDDR